MLTQIDALLDAGDFSPAAFRGEITLAISEYVGFTPSHRFLPGCSPTHRG